MKIQSTEILHWILKRKTELINETTEVLNSDQGIGVRIKKSAKLQARVDAFSEFYDFIIEKEKENGL